MRKMLSDSILDLRKCPNRKMHESEHAFFPGHFARSKIESESIYLMKYYIITIPKNWGAFQPTFNKVKKMDFPLYFQILHRRFQGFFFKLGSYFFFKWLVSSH